MEGWAWWHFWQICQLLLRSRFLCNYWLGRQGRYFRTVPKSCDTCGPPHGWPHTVALKGLSDLPDCSYSETWRHRDSSCRYQLGVQRTFVAEVGVAQSRSTFLSTSQLSVLIDQGWESILRGWPPSLLSPGLGKHPKRLATFIAFPRANLTICLEQGWQSCSIISNFPTREFSPFCKPSMKSFIRVEVVQK